MYKESKSSLLNVPTETTTKTILPKEILNLERKYEVTTGLCVDFSYIQIDSSYYTKAKEEKNFEILQEIIETFLVYAPRDNENQGLFIIMPGLMYLPLECINLIHNFLVHKDPSFNKPILIPQTHGCIITTEIKFLIAARRAKQYLTKLITEQKATSDSCNLLLRPIYFPSIDGTSWGASSDLEATEAFDEIKQFPQTPPTSPHAFQPFIPAFDFCLINSCSAHVYFFKNNKLFFVFPADNQHKQTLDGSLLDVLSSQVFCESSAARQILLWSTKEKRFIRQQASENKAYKTMYSMLPDDIKSIEAQINKISQEKAQLESSIKDISQQNNLNFSIKSNSNSIDNNTQVLKDLHAEMETQFKSILLKTITKKQQEIDSLTTQIAILENRKTELNERISVSSLKISELLQHEHVEHKEKINTLSMEIQQLQQEEKTYNLKISTVEGMERQLHFDRPLHQSTTDEAERIMIEQYIDENEITIKKLLNDKLSTYHLERDKLSSNINLLKIEKEKIILQQHNLEQQISEFKDPFSYMLSFPSPQNTDVLNFPILDPLDLTQWSSTLDDHPTVDLTLEQQPTEQAINQSLLSSTMSPLISSQAEIDTFTSKVQQPTLFAQKMPDNHKKKRNISETNFSSVPLTKEKKHKSPRSKKQLQDEKRKSNLEKLISSLEILWELKQSKMPFNVRCTNIWLYISNSLTNLAKELVTTPTNQELWFAWQTKMSALSSLRHHITFFLKIEHLAEISTELKQELGSLLKTIKKSTREYFKKVHLTPSLTNKTISGQLSLDYLWVKNYLVKYIKTMTQYQSLVQNKQTSVNFSTQLTHYHADFAKKLTKLTEYTNRFDEDVAIVFYTIKMSLQVVLLEVNQKIKSLNQQTPKSKDSGEDSDSMSCGPQLPENKEISVPVTSTISLPRITLLAPQGIPISNKKTNTIDSQGDITSFTR